MKKRLGLILLLLVIFLLATFGTGGCDLSDQLPPSQGSDIAVKNMTFSNHLGQYSTDIYYPALENGCSYTVNTNGAPFPVIIFSPGSLANKDMYTWIGHVFAKAGYITALYSTPTGFTEDVNKEFNERLEGTRTLYQTLKNSNATEVSFLKSVMDTEKLIVSGHSLGAMVAIYEASKNPVVKAVLALAPANDIIPFTEEPSQGKFSYDELTAPVQFFVGDNDDLVPQTWQIYGDTLARKEILQVKGANHVGFMDDSFLFDLAPCLGQDNEADITTSQTHAIAAPYMRAWLAYFVRNEVMNREILFGNNPMQDKAQGRLSEYAFQE